MTALDYLITHQPIILIALAAVLVLLVAVALKWHGLITAQTERAMRPDLGLLGAIRTHDARYLSAIAWFLLDRLVQRVRRMRVLFVVIVIVFSVAGAIAAVTDWTPIPKTALLTLPQIETTPSGKPANKLLIFIHGWNGDDHGTWQKFPQLARNDPRLADYDIWPINYPTYIFTRQLDIESLAGFFDDQFQKVYGIDGRYERIVIICHSMGGLVARRIFIRRVLRGADNSRYVALIEIATPHHGAKPAALAAALGLSRDATDEMKTGSRFLNVLQDDWRQLQRRRPPTFCLGSTHDGVVDDQNSALADCDDGVLYPTGYSHTALVKPDNAQDERYTMPVAHIPGVPPLPLPARRTAD